MSDQTISTEEVRHIAKLAKIPIDDAEVAKYQKSLSSILTFVSVLEDVDTEGVQETSQVTGLTNVTQEDEVEVYPPEMEKELLGCSNLPKNENQITIPKMM